MADATRRGEAARTLKRVDEDKSKYDGGDCALLGKASLKCIEDNGYDRKAPDCQKHYEAYRECRRIDNEARRAKGFF